MGKSVHNWALQKRNSFSPDFANARKDLCITMIPLGHTLIVSKKHHRALSYCTTDTKENRSQDTIHFICAGYCTATSTLAAQHTLVQCWEQSRITSMCAWALTDWKNLSPKWQERCLSWIPLLNLLRSPEFLPGYLSALIPWAANKEMILLIQ